MVPAVPTLKDKVPPIPIESTETTPPVPAPPPGPTLIWTVFNVVDAIDTCWLWIGSPPDNPLLNLVLEIALGYGWFVVWLSLEQVNTNPSVAIPIVFDVVNPWFRIVKVKSPDTEL